MPTPPRLSPALIVMVAVFVVAGCGGGGGGTAPEATGATAERPDPGKHPQHQEGDQPAGREQSGEGEGASKGELDQASNGGDSPHSAFQPKPHHDSGGGSAQFKVRGGDNSIQEFGEEAPESELQRAATTLHGFFDSRAALAWGTACSYLGQPVLTTLRQLAAASDRLNGSRCPEILAALSKGAPAPVLAESAEADVGALRIEGGNAFLVYRGAREVVFAIPMVKEKGEWKMGAMTGTPLE
jgi:hypothetical protein